MKQLVDGDKNNLQQKMSGSNKYEFKKICEKLESQYHIKPAHLMGLGTSCIVYQYGSEQVIKVCAKKIKYFHDRKQRLASDLQKTVEPMAPYLLPIVKIIYDGDEFFAYIQDRCNPLPKRKNITTQNLCDILHIIQVMFANDVIVGQMKPKNVGLWKGHLVLFDYHSMHQLYDRIKDTNDWCHSLEESLLTYERLYPHKVGLQSLIDHISTIKNPHDTVEVIKHIEKIREGLRNEPRGGNYVPWRSPKHRQ